MMRAVEHAEEALAMEKARDSDTVSIGAAREAVGLPRTSPKNTLIFQVSDPPATSTGIYATLYLKNIC